MYCLKQLGFWSFVIAAIRNQYTQTKTQIRPLKMRVEVKMLTSGTNKNCKTKVTKQSPAPHPRVKSDLQTKMLEPDFNIRKFHVFF